MKAQLAMYDGTALYALRGDFDFLVREAFLSEIRARAARGQARIVLNLRRVTYLTSTGIGAMIAADKLLSASGGRLVLSQPSDAVRSSLKLVGMLDRLCVCADDAAALALCV